MNPRGLTFALLVLDVIATIAVFNFVSHVRGVVLPGQLVLWPLAAPTLALVLSIYLVDGYKPRTDVLRLEYTSLHMIASLGAMLATLMLTYVFITDTYGLHSSRLVIILSFLALGPLTLVYRRLIYLRRLKHRGTRSLVFLGDVESGRAFEVECRRMGAHQPIIFAVMRVESMAPFITQPATVCRPILEVIEEVQRGDLAVEAIVLRESARELAPEISQRLIDLYFAGVPTFTLELFHEVYWRKIPLYRLNQTWLFQEGFEIAREPVFERIKRVADIVIACIGLLLAAPLLLAAGVAIWLEDRGSVFFTQTRIGRNHVPFRIFKLRTMRVSEAPGDPYTQNGDARITRVGRFLRASRLDELPQLWNVVRGEMSMIGPRAEWDRLVLIYGNEIPCYHFRHLVKPGITGWAQVNYPYGASIDDTLRKLEYDLYYIRHFSFLLDASIVLKTIHIMLFGKGR